MAGSLHSVVNDRCVFGGRVLPRDVVGQFEDSSSVDDPRELRSRLLAHGYLFLRDVLDVSAVLAAREEVFSRLVEVGEIKLPASDGIATGQSRRLELVDDLIAFWQSVSEGPMLGWYISQVVAD